MLERNLYGNIIYNTLGKSLYPCQRERRYRGGNSGQAGLSSSGQKQEENADGKEKELRKRMALLKTLHKSALRISRSLLETCRPRNAPGFQGGKHNIAVPLLTFLF